MRKLGVHGNDLPTKKNKTVQPSDFLIGGIIGQFERKYTKAFLVRNPSEALGIFGIDFSSSYYGSETIAGFFANVVGVDAKLYIKSHVGFGTAIDAVVATSNAVDGTPATVLTITAAYQDTPEYGVSGNRTGYTITRGARFTTTGKTANTASDTFIILNSIAGIKVGDIIHVSATGGGAVDVYKKVTGLDENTNTITFSGVFHATKNMAIGDTVEVQGFQLRTWRKELTGRVSEVDSSLGKIWCTTEPEVTDFYAPTVFLASKWIKVTRVATTPATLDLTLPVAVATVTYLASGADGTAPTTVAHWANDLIAMNNLPVRFLCNPETVDTTIQAAGETYCKGRVDDHPKWLYNISSNRTKAQVIAIGNNYQRSDDVQGAIVADWLQITDPFSSGVNASLRNIPNVGHVMGVIIRTIGTKGIHYIPQKDTPIFGIQGVYNTNMSTLSDDDRTDLASAGINLIQFLDGYNYVIRNMFTPSITTEFMFLNGIVMRDYIKVSTIDSLQSSENQPNSYNRIQQDRMAVLQFLYLLWRRGSTGTVPEGETFGQSMNTDGSMTKPEDHFEVIADLTNNPQANINLGERTIDTYFTYPTPAGSIQIGVGILLRV